MKPALYVTATPIGNLQDISVRCLEILKNADMIACEDTRTTRKICEKFGMPQKRLISYVESKDYQVFSKQHMAEILHAIRYQNKSVALVSEAGSPIISDPGYKLVEEAHQMGIPVVPIPGPCAVVSALSVSGFAGSKFVFEGFLPDKPKQRLQVLQTLAHETRTMVMFESPLRIMATLHDCIQVFGEQRQVTLCREMTKVYEEIVRAPLVMAIKMVEIEPKGEFTLVIQGVSEAKTKQ